MAETGLENKDKLEMARRRLEEKMEGMSFLAHLEELRKRIIKSLLAVAVGFFACWYYADRIYAFMMVPIMEALKRNGLDGSRLVYTNPHRTIQHLLEGWFYCRPVRDLSVHPVPSLGLYCSWVVSQREAVCRAVHGLHGISFPGRRVFRVPAVPLPRWIS